MNDVSENIKSEKQWLRGLFMLLFFVIFEMVQMVMVLVAVVQFVFAVISGDNNVNLRRFGDSLSQYAHQIVQFLSYNSDDKPFPFNEWPVAKESEGSSD